MLNYRHVIYYGNLHISDNVPMEFVVLLWGVSLICWGTYSMWNKLARKPIPEMQMIVS